MTVRFTGAALRDVDHTIRALRKENRLAAAGFREAVRAAVQMIGEHPMIGHLRQDIGNDQLRFLVLSGYPYVLVYEPLPAPPTVLRVLHGARDLPGVLRG